MLFSSFEFIFLFLPICLMIVFALPARAKNAFLLFAGLIFYAFGDARHLPLMLVVIAVNYLAGIIIFKVRDSHAKKRLFLVITIVADIGILAFYKYIPMIIPLLPSEISVRAPSLPVGISFYIFQSLSYIADVYRGDCPPDRSPVNYAAYISLFPQLIAGPIVRYSDVTEELKKRATGFSGVRAGILRFCTGLGKKVLIANVAGEFFADVCALPDSSRCALLAWLGLISYMMQIYFDFSGYSDMAIGIGLMLGFHFPENFDYPYTATSVTDFWRRWHITLSSFFKSYVYIPLGGNRRGRARCILNLFIVWSLTGLWHGASLNFLLWGIYYFFFLTAEKFVFKGFIARLPIHFRRLTTLTIVYFGWLIFAFEYLSAGSGYLASMFSSVPPDGAALFDAMRMLPFFVIAAVAATPILRRALSCLNSGRAAVLRDASAAILLILSISYTACGGYNPFLYFRF